MRTLYLHIGTGKTGTTTIQDSLAANREWLRARGYVYPDLRGEHNHVPLALFATRQPSRDLFKLWIGSNEQEAIDAFRYELPMQLAKALCEDAGHDVILSSEHLTALLSDAGGIRRIRGLLEQHFQVLKVVIYLRRQDEILLSLYSTHIKAGKTKLPQELLDRPPFWFDYWRLLSMWASVFGWENLVVRLFERKRFTNGKLEDDFLSAVGLADSCGFEGLQLKNSSLDRIRLEFLRRMNEYIPRFEESGINPARGDLTRALEKNASGDESLSYNPAVMRQFYEQFAEGNRKVAKMVFGAEGDLFVPPKIKAESDAGLELTVEQAVQISAELWIDRQNVVSQLEGKVKSLREKLKQSR